MSCNLTKYCLINDLKSLKQILIPETQSEQELIRDDDWDNRWNWDTSELVTHSSSSSSDPNVNSWLTQCMITVSPFADLMAFAKNVYLAVYKVKQLKDLNNCLQQNDSQNYNELQLSFETRLTGLEPNEVITSLLLVPLVSQQKNSFGSHDWTAIIIGFSSGYLRVYTENGGLLLSQILHNESIIDIKCQTFQPISNSSEQLDEIILVYQSVVVLIDGFTLYQTLRSCRNQFAKTQSSTNLGFNFMSNSSPDHSLPFTYKKWSLENSERITDCDNCGITSRNLFDHLVSQSLYRGPYGSPKSNSPNANLLITVGENPFIGFYRAQEGTSHTILNELTQAVFNKVKNMIPLSLFGSNKSNEENSKSKIESSTPIPLRIGLFDQREGLKVNLSPNKRLAAVLDDFGRVTLIDVHKWLAIRMWKGYREAEIGWIEVDEDTNITANTKKALFLIIYAPKRGILEIWCCQMGPRVTAFNVGKNCKLIQCSYSMMGLNHIVFQQFKSMPDFHKCRCFLFDYSSATLYNIEVPFLCALTDRNSKRTRDLHLFKELKNVVKQSPINCEKIVSLVLMLKTAEVRKECLEEIIQFSNLKVIKETASQLKRQLLSSLTKNELDFENKLIAQMCSRILQICSLYERIEEFQSKEYNAFIDESSKPPDIQCLIDKLNWSGSNLIRSISLIAFRDSLISSKSINLKHSTISICETLSYFTLFSNHIVKSGDEELYNCIPLEVKIEMNDISQKTHLLPLSHFIFNVFLQTNELDFETLLRDSCVVPSNLLLLLFITWLSSKYCDYWKCWEYFSKILSLIVDMMETDITNDDNYLLSPNWKEILDIIYESDNITSALIAVNVIKSVNSKIKQQNEVKSYGDNCSDMEWETLHVDNESLNLIIKQFEDLFLLDMLLHSNQQKDDQDLESKKLSLANLMRSGPGIVSELVAKWAINSNITPDILNSLIGEQTNVNQTNDHNLENAIVLGEEAIECEYIDIKSITELLDHVRRCFPNCLESDVLLVNCCWELLVNWNKDPSLSSGLLKQSLVYLNYVSSSVLKQNVACLLWKTFIQKRFESLTNMMEKMGRTPKERICKKEIGMGENELESFIEYSSELLDFIIQTNMLAEMEPMPLFSLDDWWKSHTNSTSVQSVPLVILAIHQKIANAALVLEHSRLATSMYFIVSFQLKNSRPLSLFPNVVQHYFFKDLHSFPVYSSNSETILSETRTKFLMNVVSAIAQSLPVHNQSEHDEEYILNQTKLYSQANKWFGKVITLSREWELNVDEIRRKFVSELYFHGCDPLAEEVMTSVVDLISLGFQMLVIGGIRVIHSINAKYGSLEQMHTLPPNVLFWLKSLNVDSNCYSGSPFAATLAMLEHTNNYVHSDKTYARICDALIDAVKSFDN